MCQWHWDGPKDRRQSRTDRVHVGPAGCALHLFSLSKKHAWSSLSVYFHFKWVWVVRKQKASSTCPWYKISTERKTKGNMMNLEQGGFRLDKINTFFTIRYRKYGNSIARKGLGSSSLIKQWFYSVPLGFDSVMRSCWHWLEFNPFICLSWALFGLWAVWGLDHVRWAVVN